MHTKSVWKKSFVWWMSSCHRLETFLHPDCYQQIGLFFFYLLKCFKCDTDSHFYFKSCLISEKCLTSPCKHKRNVQIDYMD